MQEDIFGGFRIRYFILLKVASLVPRMYIWIVKFRIDYQDFSKVSSNFGTAARVAVLQNTCIKSHKENKHFMTTLTVWKFDDATGASQALSKFGELKKQQPVEIQGAAIVEWPDGKKKPKTRQAVLLVGMGALSGSFWGMLFGLIFFIPLFGMVVGAAMGAISGMFSDYGIDDDLIKSVCSEVAEETSALFLLTGNVTVDKVSEELKGQMGTLLRSNLRAEQEESLREAFGEA